MHIDIQILSWIQKIVGRHLRAGLYAWSDDHGRRSLQRHGHREHTRPRDTVAYEYMNGGRRLRYLNVHFEA